MRGNPSGMDRTTIKKALIKSANIFSNVNWVNN